MLALRNPIHLRLCLRSLREALTAVNGFTWEVSVVECDGSGPGSLSRQAFLASTALFPAARVLFNGSGERLNLTAATWRATAGTGGRAQHIFFIQDNVEVSDTALGRMVNILEHDCRVAVVGSASRKPDGSIYHRGVAFDLGPRHKRCLSSDMYEDDYSYSYSSSSRRGGGDTGPLAFTSQAIWAFHAHQGLRAPLDPPLLVDTGDIFHDSAAPTLVDAVSEGCWATRWSMWQQLRGLDPDVPDTLSVMDFCLRAHRRLYKIALQDAFWVTHHADTASSGGGGSGGNCNPDTKNIGEYIGGTREKERERQHTRARVQTRVRARVRETKRGRERESRKDRESERECSRMREQAVERESAKRE